MVPVIHYFSVAMIKCHDQNLLTEEFIFDYGSKGAKSQLWQEGVTASSRNGISQSRQEGVAASSRNGIRSGKLGELIVDHKYEGEREVKGESINSQNPPSVIHFPQQVCTTSPNSITNW